MKKISLTVLNCILVSTAFCQTISTVTNPETGRVWMDRNLGATQVATSPTDENAYGDLYQWGRNSDGHQHRTSLTTSDISDNNTPNHSEFILANSDWLMTPDDNLWQGVEGINNPCPSGFRLPTEEEVEAERLSWTSNNAEGAFASPLKLTLAGARSRMTGAVGNVGTFVGYRTSSSSGTLTRLLGISLNDSFMGNRDRADGNCIRCIMDESSTSVEEINSKRHLLKTVDVLGREVIPTPNAFVIYIFSDGTSERKFVVN